MAQFLLDTSWWVPLYGLLGALVTIPWAIGLIQRTGPRPAAYLNLLMTLLALIHSLVVLQGIWNQPAQEVLIPWLQVIDLQVSLSLEISPLSIGASVVITGLSLLAQLFALGYMEKDWALARFYALMGFFEGAMSGIVLSDSLFLSYALLEMLTLSTYLLVGFWYAQPLVVTAARDAFLTKRVGDLLLLMGVVAISTLSGDLTFPALIRWSQTVDLAPWVAALIGLALIAGPIGKCAQFPLHVWLDEAMEGPNPASILRNSVVVGCGAYVLIKVTPILALSPLVSDVLIVLGAVTALGGSLVSLAQIDIKRTFSYTTSAYLGLVFMAVGVQQTGVALEILFTHALAKGLIFMGIGSIILTCVTQNLTELGGLGRRMPATTTAFWVGSAGMVAVLPLGGFWSMLALFQGFWGTQPWLIGVLLTMNGLLAATVTRAYGLAFTGSSQPKTRRAPEVIWSMALPMVILAVLTLLVPWMLWECDLIPIWSDQVTLAAGLLSGSGLVGFGIGWYYYLRPGEKQPFTLNWGSLQQWLAQDFYVDRLYRVVVVVPFAAGARLIDWVDRFLVDGLVNGVSLVLILGAEGLKYTISGRGQAYLLTILIAVVVVIVWVLSSLTTAGAS